MVTLGDEAFLLIEVLHITPKILKSLLHTRGKLPEFRCAALCINHYGEFSKGTFWDDSHNIWRHVCRESCTLRTSPHTQHIEWPARIYLHRDEATTVLTGLNCWCSRRCGP